MTHNSSKRSSFLKLSSMALAIATISTGTYAAQLEEIIVTAQKRAQSLQDVPISMTAITGERMQDAGITSFADLSGFVPNLGISENAVNTIISMRGISVGANQSFEQSVGVYVDGVHYGKSRQIRTGLFDLQQVEVLRGPQGILFGKNTLAGAINVTTAEPEMGEGMSGKIAATVETDDGELFEGHLNYSPSDNLGFRLALRDRSDGGYMDNSFANATNGAPSAMPTTDETIWRFTTMWDPNESTSVKFTHGESDFVRVGGPGMVTTFAKEENIPASNSLMYAVMGIISPEFKGNVDAGVFDANRDGRSIGGLALSQSLGRDLDRTEEKFEGTDTQTSDTALRIDIEMDNGYSFHSVTGRNTYDYEDGMDADWLPVTFVGRSDISDYSQTSQEFRLASPTDKAFSFVAGVYWSKAEQDIDRTVIVDGTLGNPGTVKYVTGVGALTDPATGEMPEGTTTQDILDAGTSSFLAFSKPQIAGAILQTADPATIGAALTGGSDGPYGAVFDAVNNMWGVDGGAMWNQAGRVSNYSNETDTVAAFFQGTYELSDTLTLTAGVRYTEEDKEAFAKADLTASYTGLATPNETPFLAALQAASFGVWAHDFNEKRSTSQVIPAANLQWEQSDTSKYYISYSEGFKSGGFNSVDDQNPEIAADGTVLRTTPGIGFEYDDESASSFEIGGKHVLLDGAMNLNWAYFNSEYEDQQVSTFVGLGFVVANAASSEIQGIEMDMAWQATDELRLGLAMAFLDGSYGNFDAAGCTATQASALLGLGTLTSSSPVTSALGCQQQFLGNGDASGSSQDISGGQLGSDYSGSITADYIKPLANGLVWFAGMDINFTDMYYMTGDLDPIDIQSGFEKVNLRTGIRGDDWDVMLFGRNITDEITASGAADVPLAGGAHFSYMARGAVWGARFSYSF
jgi:outer membrane receptor protein involved in Fe transport